MDKDFITTNLLNIVAMSTMLMNVEKIVSIAVLITALVYNIIKLNHYFKTKKLK